MSSYPPTLTSFEKKHIVDATQDWCLSHGLVLLSTPPASENRSPGVLSTPAPITLFPSSFPKKSFEEATRIQVAYNALYASISSNVTFLEQIVTQLSEDDFVQQLWSLHQEASAVGISQSLSLGLFRSDYMIHQSDGNYSIKQVEFNTIAASFYGLSCKTSQLHKFLAKTIYPNLLSNKLSVAPSSIPVNGDYQKSQQPIASAFRRAHDSYIENVPENLGYQRCILFIVQDGERNVFDQRELEYQISASGLVVFRVPFSKVLDVTSVAPMSKARQLLYHIPMTTDSSRVTYEVAVVYYRAGYDPSDYTNEISWKTRLYLETSHAIKCPTILTQLAGTKKVQQILATPGKKVLQDLLPLPFKSAADQIWDTFVGIYPMDTSESGNRARSLALDSKTSSSYVLKPQREGGGHNIYRQAIPAFLQSIPQEKWASYILMELITPPPRRNVILRQGLLEEGNVINELGVYGACLWDNSKEANLDDWLVFNEELGYLLRTKGDQSEEGGVAAGFGSMDSCYLTDENFNS